MVRIISLFSILLSLGCIQAERSHFEVSATTLYSPQIAEYYTSLMYNLRFLYYADSYPPSDFNSESLFGSNIRSTTDLSCNYSWMQGKMGSWSFTPLLHISFSHKRLKFQRGINGFLNVTYYYTYQRLTNLYAGIAPEFSRPLTPIIKGGHTPYMALRPMARVVQHFSYGQLDSIRFTSGQIGVESQFGFVGSPRGEIYSRGLSLSLIVLYERAFHGNRHLNTTYASVIHKESHFPKSSWSIGMALSYSIRTFGKGDSQ